MKKIEIDKPDAFRAITAEMADLYERKNADYGDSFGRSVEKYGFIASLTRISDKFNRLESLILNKGKAQVNTESLRDTAIDLAAYAIMTVIELQNKGINEDENLWEMSITNLNSENI